MGPRATPAGYSRPQLTPKAEALLFSASLLAFSGPQLLLASFWCTAARLRHHERRRRRRRHCCRR